MCLIIHDLHYRRETQPTCGNAAGELYPTWIHSHPARNGSR
jgi:hypothetical protein